MNLGKNKLWARIMVFILLLASILLNSCSNGGARNNISNVGTNIGTLPNGSTVYASPVSFNTSPGGGPVNGQIGISGGTSFYSTTITFNNSIPVTTLNQQFKYSFVNLTQPYADTNGITVTTNPRPCLVGTAGSSLPTSCQVTISAASTTSAGTYSITPVANSSGGSLLC